MFSEGEKPNFFDMKIALAQLNYTIGDIAGNTAKIIIAVERAKEEGADVVLFAEQALCGTPAFDLLRKSTFIELCVIGSGDRK